MNELIDKYKKNIVYIVLIVVTQQFFSFFNCETIKNTKIKFEIYFYTRF